MILLLGATGYIGQAFARELSGAERDVHRALAQASGLHAVRVLLEISAKRRKPEFVINAAGYTGKPNVDACEMHKADTLQGNTLFAADRRPGLRGSRNSLGTCFLRLHFFSGAKITENGQVARGKRFDAAGLAGAGREKSPQSIHGFTETDKPNFSFRDRPCSFYSGTKALGEEAITALAKVISGGCGFRSMNSTMRAII